MGESSGETNAGIVGKLEIFVKAGGKDLRKFLNESATTPPAPIQMLEFSEGLIKENILRNLFRQGKKFSQTLSKNLIDFFQLTSQCIEHKIYLQILLHISKCDLPEAELNETLASFLRNAKKNKIDEFYSIKLASEGEAKNIKNFLKCPVSLVAIEKNINVLFTETVDRDHLVDLIDKMNIYMGNICFCLPGLRGACLLDGIVIFSGKVADREDCESIREADLATLSIHEALHFILRCIAKDFNLSSPFKSSDSVRKDAVHPASNLEMGRQIEYDLFDGVRPLWVDSEPGAAEEFLKRLKNPETTLPVIEKGEYDNLGLNTRVHVSTSFSCDYVFEPNFC